MFLDKISVVNHKLHLQH